MDRETLIAILQKIEAGDMSANDALREIKIQPFADYKHTLIDRHREIRKGHPEVIYGESKTIEQIIDIVSHLQENCNNIIVTRLTKEKAAALTEAGYNMDFNEQAGIAIINKKVVTNCGGLILVLTGGTSDIPVAEEAAVTAEAMGNRVERLYDVGVAGLHRLLSHLELIDQASVIIAVAGMEGALAGVVAGLNDKPVIAVPTSVGYGANFKGVSALLTMLNSCAGGVSVVNIDNGFGAGYTAGLINRQIENGILKRR